MGDQQTSKPSKPATPKDGAVEGQPQTSVLADDHPPKKTRIPPAPPKGGNPRKCAVCALPPEILEKVNEMLIGTPGDPNGNPPEPATWTMPNDLSKWLMSCDPPHIATVDSIRYHQHAHLKIYRSAKSAPKAAPSSLPPIPPTSSKFLNGHKLDQAPNVTLPAKSTGQPPVKIERKRPTIPKKQPPPLEQTNLLNEDDVGDEGVEVVDGPQREEDRLDQMVLEPTLPNSDLACVEFAIREGAKFFGKFARNLRKRTDGRLSQQEAVIFTTFLPNLTNALASYRQTLAMSKGGRYGAPEIMDQKRGLKSLLQKERTVLPHDMPPKDAEPVGVPIPIEEQLAPVVTSTLPFDADALPESPPVPTFSLSDLPSPAAPDSSSRPVTSDGGSTAMVHVAKAVGDSVGGGGGENPLAPGGQKGDGGTGATVTPIKKWDAVM